MRIRSLMCQSRVLTTRITSLRSWTPVPIALLKVQVKIILDGQSFGRIAAPSGHAYQNIASMPVCGHGGFFRPPPSSFLSVAACILLPILPMILQTDFCRGIADHRGAAAQVSPLLPNIAR